MKEESLISSYRLPSQQRVGFIWFAKDCWRSSNCRAADVYSRQDAGSTPAASFLPSEPWVPLGTPDEEPCLT